MRKDDAAMMSPLLAMGRTAAAVHLDMGRGLKSLATIASIAPLVGIFGTSVGIVYSFRGVIDEKSAQLAALTLSLAEAIWPTALSLAIALIAFACHKYLTSRLETIDREMRTTTLDLINQLSLYRARLKPGPTIGAAATPPMFGAISPAELEQERKFRNRAVMISAAALLLAWCIQIVHYFDESFPLGEAAMTAAERVLFVLAASCALTYGAWVKLLHRRAGGLALLASLLCLAWCALELR